MDFDVSYFEEETRLGFAIPEFMKHAWAAQLNVLNRIDKICRDNNIPYYANWGTLLGTVRHQGYIPWDDDIDICMLRADINRLAELIEACDDIEMISIFNTPNHGPNANRVVTSTAFSMDRDVYKDSCGFPFSAGVDIFVLDYVPRDKALEEEMVEALQVCATAAHERLWLEENDPFDNDYTVHIHEYRAAIEWLSKNCGVTFSEEDPSEQEILILAQEIMGLYSEADSDYITEMHTLVNGSSYYIPKDVFDNIIRLPFENTSMPVPIAYNEMLTLKYGSSYMTPMNIQAGHDYTFYNRLIKAMYNDRKYNSLEEYTEYLMDISARYYVNFLKKKAEPVLDYDREAYNDLISGMHISKEEGKKLVAECEVLEEFKRICNSIDISYYAIGDTLRAIESGDYFAVISDGVNVSIKRENVNDLLMALSKELDPWFNYSAIYYIDDYENLRFRIWTDGYKCDMEEFAKRFHGCTEEVSLYISVIDKVSPDKEQDEVRMTLVKNLIATSKSMPTTPPYSADILGIVAEWKKIIQAEINTETNLRQEFLRVADYIGGNVTEDSTVDKVRITADLQRGDDTVYPRDYFEKAKEVPFFITAISVPGLE